MATTPSVCSARTGGCYHHCYPTLYYTSVRAGTDRGASSRKPKLNQSVCDNVELNGTGSPELQNRVHQFNSGRGLQAIPLKTPDILIRLLRVGAGGFTTRTQSYSVTPRLYSKAEMSRADRRVRE